MTKLVSEDPAWGRLVSLGSSVTPSNLTSEDLSIPEQPSSYPRAPLLPEPRVISVSAALSPS